MKKLLLFALLLFTFCYAGGFHELVLPKEMKDSCMFTVAQGFSQEFVERNVTFEDCGLKCLSDSACKYYKYDNDVCKYGTFLQFIDDKEGFIEDQNYITMILDTHLKDIRYFAMKCANLPKKSCEIFKNCKWNYGPIYSNYEYFSSPNGYCGRSGGCE